MSKTTWINSIKWTRRKTLATITVALLAVICAVVWNVWFSRTYIAFVNFQPMTLQGIAQANDNPFVKLFGVDEKDVDKLSKYDIVFINSMGLNIDAEQRREIQDLAKSGVPVYTSMATNPDNNISNLPEEATALVREYLSNGGKKNYRSLLSYLRRNIDGKLLFTGTPDKPQVTPTDYLWYPTDGDEEELMFENVADYEKFIRKKGIYIEGAQRIIVTGQITDPTDLVKALVNEKKYNVFPVNSFTHLQDYAEKIHPDAIINLAHGRLGDDMVDYLKANNVLLFDPLTVNEPVEDWEADPMGMVGGFMSQSVVMPEIDGAIRTSVLFAQEKDKNGLLHAYAIPERLKTFTATIDNYMALRIKANAEKRVAIIYFKGPGQSGLVASRLNVVPSLYNLLRSMKEQGYNLNGLPTTLDEFARQIQQRGSLFNSFAAGNAAEFMKKGRPQLVTKAEYDRWTADCLRKDKRMAVDKAFGKFPGDHNMLKTDDGRLAFPCLRYGNIVLLPQPMAGEGKDEFKIVHGTDQVPPHSYIAPYLWVQYGFKADALVHFGTHGSLEFTPQKQIALSNNDWADRLVGPLPHFYLYTIDNVGEAMTAKRRSYATIITHLTPPFHESDLRNTYKELEDALRKYSNGKGNKQTLALKIKRLSVEMGLTKDLNINSDLKKPLTEAEIERIETYADELTHEKVAGTPYTMGVAYSQQDIRTSVEAMTIDPIAYSKFNIDKLTGRVKGDIANDKIKFNDLYIYPTKRLVAQLYDGNGAVGDAVLCKVTGISEAQLAKCRKITAYQNAQKGMLAMMQAAAKKGKKMNGGKPSGMGTGTGSPSYSKQEIELAKAVAEIETALNNVRTYRNTLSVAHTLELQAFTLALNGGYIAPSPGGDPIANPNTLPTGRNLFAINAEETPTEDAWEKGVALAKNLITDYQKRHKGEYPKKVSYTLWSGEFIQTGGATIAQALYMLGVEPVRDRFGRVSDIKLIPSEELGRPRIDVVVQTSGQLRDLAASRLFLITKAVKMAAEAPNGKFGNKVKEGVEESERYLIDKGVSPKNARELSTYRVFGGLNGSYATNIQGLVEKGDAWDNDKQIADTYINNMGGFYGDEEHWQQDVKDAFAAALTRTDIVVQPRQNNSWGALSLDHVYEFMGGMNLAVRSITGKDPDAVFSDYRNRNNYKLQESKEAIAVEARTKLLNENYIKDVLKGGTTATDALADMVRNTYGWNVTKPTAIDEQMWNEIYAVYVEDKYNIGIHEQMGLANPAAMEEMTATMMETARKGYWKATPEQLAEMAKVHTSFVRKYGPTGTSFEGDNSKLQEFIAQKASVEDAKAYSQNMRQMTEAASQKDAKGMVMKKTSTSTGEDATEEAPFDTGIIAVAVVLIVFFILLITIKRKRK